MIHRNLNVLLVRNRPLEPHSNSGRGRKSLFRDLVRYTTEVAVVLPSPSGSFSVIPIKVSCLVCPGEPKRATSLIYPTGGELTNDIIGPVH